MKNTHSGLIIGLAILVVSTALSASALPTFTKTVKDTYAIPTNGQLDKAKCSLCHTSLAKGDTLNPFGASLETALDAQKTKKLTRDILARIESLDADKDGVSNLEELTADSLPGNAASKPTASHAWQLTRLAAPVTLEQVSAALVKTRARIIAQGAVPLAEVHAAVSGEQLAVAVRVFDRKITPALTTWDGASFSLAAAAPADTKTFRQVVFTPTAPDAKGNIALLDTGKELAVPQFACKVTPLKEYGYELTALIPLSALRIDPKATSLLLEGAVVAAPVADAAAQFASLFGSPDRYTDAGKFGTVTLVDETK